MDSREQIKELLESVKTALTSECIQKIPYITISAALNNIDQALSLLSSPPAKPKCDKYVFGVDIAHGKSTTCKAKCNEDGTLEVVEIKQEETDEPNGEYVYQAAEPKCETCKDRKYVRISDVSGCANATIPCPDCQPSQDAGEFDKEKYYKLLKTLQDIRSGDSMLANVARTEIPNLVNIIEQQAEKLGKAEKAIKWAVETYGVGENDYITLGFVEILGESEFQRIIESEEK